MCTYPPAPVHTEEIQFVRSLLLLLVLEVMASNTNITDRVDIDKTDATH